LSDTAATAASPGTAAAPESDAPEGRARIGFLRFAPRITQANAWTFLYLNLMIMPIVSFLSFSQPYVLKEIIGIPAEEQGRITGFLVTMQEIVALCLVGFAGGLSDRFGRRPIYALGVLIAGIGFALYGTANSATDLYIYRFVYAVGVALAGVMIAVTAADYPAEACRGKLAGTTGLLNGLGVLLGTVIFATLPSFLQSQGVSNAMAGRYMLWAMAGLAISTAIVMQLGLAGGTPTGRIRKTSLAQTLRTGIAEGAANPRLLVCYAGAFVSRADLTLIAVFVSLWLQQVARNEGLDGPAALKQATFMFVLIQLSSLLWAPVAGFLLDRYHRLVCVVGALLIAGVGYTLLGLQAQPFSPIGYAGAVLVGMGQMSCILSTTALLGQESPIAVRGSVIGLASLCGAVGILATSFIGGYLFDHVAISAPIVLTGLANLIVFGGALMVWLRTGRPVHYDPDEAGAREPIMVGH
jgi:MFS family permease